MAERLALPTSDHGFETLTHPSIQWENSKESSHALWLAFLWQLCYLFWRFGHNRIRHPIHIEKQIKLLIFMTLDVSICWQKKAIFTWRLLLSVLHISRNPFTPSKNPRPDKPVYYIAINIKVRNERYKPRNNDADIARYWYAISKLHIFFRSVMPVC